MAFYYFDASVVSPKFATHFKRHSGQAGDSRRDPESETFGFDYLGNDIYELRVAIDQHQHRLLYFFHGRSVIVVTSGLLKNEGKVPQSVIERAGKYRADWLKRFGGER